MPFGTVSTRKVPVGTKSFAAKRITCYAVGEQGEKSLGENDGNQSTAMRDTLISLYFVAVLFVAFGAAAAVFSLTISIGMR